MRGWLALRSLLFYIGYTLLTTWFSLSAVIFLSFAPYMWSYRYLMLWNRSVLGWLRLSCGVRYRVVGRDNLPSSPCVILSKHQSQWETFFLQILLLPVVPVLKRELLSIPGFGWAIRQIHPIAIDRGNPKQALQQINSQGLDRLANGCSVYLFPEGTRIPYGEKGKYARGGARLAIDAGVPLVPVAHNAGKYWPARQFIKYPGTISVVIGEPIDCSGRDSRSVTAEVEAWIEGQLERMAELSSP